MLLSSFSSFWTSKLSNDSLMKRLCGLADSWRDDELSHLISMVHVFSADYYSTKCIHIRNFTETKLV